MIRRVTLDDAARIAGIYNEYIEKTTISFETEPLTDDEMRDRIGVISSKYPYFVYETDGDVAGYCYVHEWKERKAYFHTLEVTIYLDGKFRGRGIGRELMSHLIDECRKDGHHVLIACITGDNEASIAFHRSLGFSEVSRFSEVGFKFGRWLDVVDMELKL